jgi:tellurium resistance protein TerZ
MTISLSKGQSVSLEKASPGLSVVRMGLGWDAVKKGGFLAKMFGGGGGGEIDLDASCLMFAGTEVIDTVWFRKLGSSDGSIRHSGDNRTGDGDGDDETIMVDLSRLPHNVTGLVFTVNSFTGQTFDEVENATCRLVDEKSGKEICKYVLSERGRHTGVYMAAMVRRNGAWELTAIGDVASGRTVQDLAPGAARYL